MFSGYRACLKTKPSGGGTFPPCRKQRESGKSISYQAMAIIPVLETRASLTYQMFFVLVSAS